MPICGTRSSTSGNPAGSPTCRAASKLWRTRSINSCNWGEHEDRHRRRASGGCDAGTPAPHPPAVPHGGGVHVAVDRRVPAPLPVPDVEDPVLLVHEVRRWAGGAPLGRALQLSVPVLARSILLALAPQHDVDGARERPALDPAGRRFGLRPDETASWTSVLPHRLLPAHDGARGCGGHRVPVPPQCW